MGFLYWVFTYTHAVSQTLSIFLFVQVVNANRIIDQGEYDRQLSNVEGCPLMGGDVRWHGFHASKGILSEGGFRKIHQEGDPPDDSTPDVEEDDRVGSVRFGGVGVRSEVAEFGSERLESVRGESSEGDLEIGEIGVCSIGQTSSSSQVATSGNGKVLESNSRRRQEEEDLILRYYNNPCLLVTL